ncbi:SDR family oxidoreductase [Pseudomonas sp. BN505]|uniref:SDR family oxidoreductase n=1 Tax=Pseudomonas sp. BN505 TaxID=2567891 RepID=UPI0024552D41|nr:SDR family oxidoreductase [Pseudomonas sp. BN505]MDH4844140.1 SDR family oxidoreductase [Pseudomonas sp. BN605]MDH4859573.1 SDR family oxidoreductase [Pseudomonas sp. BN505]
MPNYYVRGMAKASLKAGVRYLAGSLGPEGTRANAIRQVRSAPWPLRASRVFARYSTKNENQTPLRRNVTMTESATLLPFCAQT